MRTFVVYVSWEIVVLYGLITAAYVGATAFVVVALASQGHWVGAAALSPVIALSWVGIGWQYSEVIKASREMRQHLPQ